jgi:CRP-like cAMP-binding protein
MSVEDDISLLERTPTLSLLGRQALRILAIGAETRYIHSGAVLFAAGEEAEGAFVVQEGSFSLATSNGGTGMTVGRCTLLGELALFTEIRRPATARALEPSTVLCIPRQLFLKMLDSFPEAANQLRAFLAARLDESTRDISNLRLVLDIREAKPEAGSGTEPP